VIDAELAIGTCRLGRVRLPGEFVKRYPEDSDLAEQIAAAMSAVEPLLRYFDTEANLGRGSFTLKINERADECSMSPVSLRRLLLRYWYFGGVRQAVLPLRRGPAEGTTMQSLQELTADGAVHGAPQRRGRQPRLAAKFGKITFVPLSEDLADMVGAMERCAREGLTTFVSAHKSYLKTEFAKRNAVLYKRTIAGRILPPISLRQFSRYVKAHEQLSEQLRQNAPALGTKQSARALHSSGPGDVYELDATGGQILLVDSKNAGRILGKPTIYIIVAVYVTLGAPSAEALRLVLRIAFTSRTRRFKLLGIPIDDARWPRGVVPAHIAVDRGGDMISESMLQTAVEGLRIEVLVLPPLTPDGKAIVERVIRTLKDKLRTRGTPGMYAKVVIGPQGKKKAIKAREAAVYTLKELYRALIKVVDEYNHGVHKGLEKRSDLRVAQVPPVPVAAYLWGLTHLTGIQHPPLTDEDYTRMTLAPDVATLVNGIVRYRKQRYFPDNAAAKRLARKSTGVGKSLPVGIDRSDLSEIYSDARSDEEWAKWRIDEAGQAWLRGITAEEEDGLHAVHSMVQAQAKHEAFLEEVKSHKPVRSGHRKPASRQVDSPEVLRKRSQDEITTVTHALSGKAPAATAPVKLALAHITKLAQRLEEEEDAATVAKNRRGGST
jgi:hypothetical protein